MSQHPRCRTWRLGTVCGGRGGVRPEEGCMLLLAVLLFGDSSHVVQLAVSPQESVSVTVAGGGGGEPVVLVPGLFGSAVGYRHLIPLLVGAGYRAIVFEPLGVGPAARPQRAGYSLRAQAERLATVLDTLRVRQAVIIGHDVGAAIALRLAYRRPDLVRAIVSLEGGPAEAAATPGFRRAMRFAPWIKMFGGYGRVRREVRRSLVASSGDTSWVSDAVVDGYTTGAAHNFDGTLKAYVRMAHAREPERLVSPGPCREWSGESRAPRCPRRRFRDGVPRPEPPRPRRHRRPTPKRCERHVHSRRAGHHGADVERVRRSRDRENPPGADPRRGDRPRDRGVGPGPGDELPRARGCPGPRDRGAATPACRSRGAGTVSHDRPALRRARDGRRLRLPPAGDRFVARARPRLCGRGRGPHHRHPGSCDRRLRSLGAADSRRRALHRRRRRPGARRRAVRESPVRRIPCVHPGDHRQRDNRRLPGLELGRGDARRRDLPLRRDAPRGAGSRGHPAGPDRGTRSEERRVGKECRSRWSPYH